MGIDEKMMPIAEEYLKEEENIYLVFINKDLISISSKLKNKNTKKKENYNLL